MSNKSPLTLLKERRFGPLFVAMFLNAFNDNLYKNALVLLITFSGASLLGMSPAILITLAAGVFILPYFLFSATAGQFADKYDKALLIRRIKFMEIIIMGIASIGLITNSIGLLMLALFMMGTQSAFFGPLKYGILPDHLNEHELMGGNAIVETGTFLAILLGTIAGGLLIMVADIGPYIIAGGVMTMALLGYLAAWFVPRTKAADPTEKLNPNIVAETWSVMKFSAHKARIMWAIIGIGWFWLVGATFLAQFPTLTKVWLGGDEQVVTLLLTAFSVGIGIGSMLCNKLTKGEPSTRFVVWGSLGLSAFIGLFCFAVWLLPPVAEGAALMSFWAFMSLPLNWLVLVSLIGIAVSGGVYIVPLMVVLQHESDPGHRSRTIASNNIVSALFMVASAAGSAGLLALGFSVVHLFILVGLLNLPVAFMCWKKFRQ